MISGPSRAAIKREEQEVTFLFYTSIMIKGVISIAEIMGGIIIMILPIHKIADALVAYAEGTLVDDPGDFIATHALTIAHQLEVTSAWLVGFYLISRGLIKLGLVAALLKNKLWAYPLSLIVLAAFMAYQIYDYVAGHSVLIAAITVFDAIVMYLIWREYDIVRRHAHNKR